MYTEFTEVFKKIPEQEALSVLGTSTTAENSCIARHNAVSIYNITTSPLSLEFSKHVLSPDHIHLLVCNIDDTNNDIYFPFLSEEEKNISQQFYRVSLQKRYARAHGFLRCVLARYLNTSAQSIHIQKDVMGKPYIQDSKLFFNLTHTESLAAIAIRLGGKVGIDIEYIQTIAERWHIIERWFSSEERAWIQHSTAPNRDFLRCWVCREAILKADGSGLSALENIKLYPTNNALLLKNSPFKLVEFMPQVNYVGAVAYL